MKQPRDLDHAYELLLDADADIDDVKRQLRDATNTIVLADKQNRDMLEQIRLQKAVAESVWADHERQFAEIEKRAKNAETELSETLGTLHAVIRGQPLKFGDSPTLVYVNADDLARLRQENERLAAIVERLPETADGVHVVPPVELFTTDKEYPIVVVYRYDHLDDADIASFAKYYSTRELAEQAREAAAAKAQPTDGKDHK